MPRTSFDSVPFAFNCPKCGQKITSTVGAFKKPKAKCPRCGAGFDTTQFSAKIKEAEEMADKTLRDISQTINIKLRL